MILESDGVTLTTAMETTVQGEGKEGHPEFPNKVDLCTSPVEDHASNRAAETVLAKESSAQEGKRSSMWETDIWPKRSTRTDEHLVLIESFSLEKRE